METREYEVSFTTPAFLGDAKQQGQWRTPAFKALIRQWWRVVVAKQYKYDADKIRQVEAELFGSAAEKEKGGKSKLRLRLGHWQRGSLSSWQTKGFTRLNGQVSADAYLGFGPVDFKQKLAHAPCLSDREKNTLKLGFDPKCTTEQMKEIDQAMQLIAWFGTLGGRSRNGWGSLYLKQKGSDDFGFPSPQTCQAFAAPLEAAPLEDRLSYDYTDSYTDSEWACAFATDKEGLLIWQQDVSSWQQAIDILAGIRKESRQAVKETKHHGVHATHLLGYPVMKPAASAWQKEARVPNQLRFKVSKHGKAYRLYVFHLPCTVPESVWKPNENGARDWVEHKQLAIWQTVHQFLDNNKNLQRIGGAS